MLFSTLGKNICHLLVKWEVVSPNSRWGVQWESIYPIESSIPFLISNISNVGGGGGNIFLAFYAIPTFLEKLNYGNKKLNILFVFIEKQ